MTVSACRKSLKPTLSSPAFFLQAISLPKMRSVLVLLLFLSALISNASHAVVAPLSVSGAQINVGTEPTGLAGNSYFWSNTGWGAERFYTAESVRWLKDDWQSNIVRAAMGVETPGAYLQDKAGNKARVKTIVDAAIAEDMYVIIDWHTHHAEDYQADAVEFFTEMAQTYGQHNNVIYEIYNEPLQVSWTNTIKPYAEAVIAAIRTVDPDNLIVVGTPTWSQDVDQAAADPITAYNNIAYTLHFYAGTHKQSLRDRAEQAMNAGIAIMVTEWGTVNANGDGNVDTAETNAWINWMKQHNLTHLNWSVNDKVEGASILQPGASSTGGWSATNLTPSGTLVRDLIRDYSSDPGGGDNGGGGNTACESASPFIVSGTIEAENFCAQNGVQTQATSDDGGGENIGWIENGDWTEYAVNVSNSGEYLVELRVASQTAGGQIDLSLNGNKVGDITVANTGGWQSWQTLSTTVNLSAGRQVLRLNFVGGSNGLFNVNWLTLSENIGGGGSTDGGSEVECEFVVSNQWQDGFVGEISITNNGAQTIAQEWSVSFQFTDGSTVSSSWNASLSGANPYTLAPVSWNKTIPAGNSVSFGVQAIKGVPGAPAPNPAVQGTICN